MVTYFNILIGQIYFKLSKNTKKGKYFQVEEVKDFLKKNSEYMPIYNLIRPMFMEVEIKYQIQLNGLKPLIPK